MPVIGYKIRKNQRIDLKKSLKMLMLGPEMSYYPIFGIILFVLKKWAFTCLSNRNYMQKIRKKVMWHS